MPCRAVSSRSSDQQRGLPPAEGSSLKLQLHASAGQGVISHVSVAQSTAVCRTSRSVSTFDDTLKKILINILCVERYRPLLVALFFYFRNECRGNTDEETSVALQ